MKVELNTNNLEKAKNDLKKYVYDKIEEFEKALKKTVLDTENINFLIEGIDNLKRELEQPITKPLMYEKYLTIDTEEIKRKIESICNNNLDSEQTIKELNKLKISNFQKVGKSNIKRLEKFEEILSSLEITYSDITLFKLKLEEIKTKLNYIIDNNLMENELLEEIEELKIKLTDRTKKYITNNYDDLLRESIFINGYSKELNEIDELTENQIFKLNELINENQIKILVIINFLILVKNIRENKNRGYPEKKPDFDRKVESIKNQFKKLQKQTDEQLYYKVPRLKADLVYEFDEFLTRYKFCTDDIIRALFDVLGYQRTPKENKLRKERKRILIRNRVNAIREIQELYKNQFNLSDKELKEYTINLSKAEEKANQYKAKKL